MFNFKWRVAVQIWTRLLGHAVCMYVFVCAPRGHTSGHSSWRIKLFFMIARTHEDWNKLCRSKISRSILAFKHDRTGVILLERSHGKITCYLCSYAK